MLVLDRSRIYQGSLILVNRRYPLRHNPRKRELCSVSANQPQIYMECESAAMLRKLLKEVQCRYSDSKNANLQESANGKGKVLKIQPPIVGVSGYRSREEQVKIFEGSLQENGRKFTETYVAFPDHSEHQTGLAIDLAKNSSEIDFICPDFPYEGVCQKFRERMADFGFIERYPQEKQEVTGIGAEPWHFRYVGVPHARIIQEMGMVLEEYVEWLKQFDLQSNPLSLFRANLPHGRSDGECEEMEIRIGYVKAQGDYTMVEYDRDFGKYTRIEYVGAQGDFMGMEGQLRPGMRISGNNADGFIFTCIMGKNSQPTGERNRE